MVQEPTSTSLGGNTRNLYYLASGRKWKIPRMVRLEKVGAWIWAGFRYYLSKASKPAAVGAKRMVNEREPENSIECSRDQSTDNYIYTQTGYQNDVCIGYLTAVFGMS